MNRKATIGIATFFASFLQTQLAAPAQAPRTFDAVSVRPASSSQVGAGIAITPVRYTALTVTAKQIIMDAYGIMDWQLETAPPWVSSSLFTVMATETQPQSPDQMKELARGMLADRFQLRISKDVRPTAVYEIRQLPSGIKAPKKETLTARIPAETAGTIWITSTLDTLADYLNKQGNLDRPVVNRTGLDGEYLFTFVPLPATVDKSFSGSVFVAGLPEQPELISQIRDRLGLDLVKAVDPIPFYAITSIAMPSADQ